MPATSASEMATATGFSRMIPVEDSLGGGPINRAERGREFCAQLEAGNIVFLPVSPIAIAQEDRELLLGRKQTGSAYHKNIAYRPSEDRVTGLDESEKSDAEVLRRILGEFSRRSTEFLAGLSCALRGKVEAGLREFSADRGEGTPRAATRAQRPAAFRFVSRRGRRTGRAFCASS